MQASRSRWEPWHPVHPAQDASALEGQLTLQAGGWRGRLTPPASTLPVGPCLTAALPPSKGGPVNTPVTGAASSSKAGPRTARVAVYIIFRARADTANVRARL